jgi:NTP pyrophosphatase (non-canonical NTP hydrolase)
MKQIQKTVDDWAQTLKVPYWQPLENMARLSEEVGELAREINIRYGAKKKKPTEDSKDIEDEMGDIIFTLAYIANGLGLDLERGFNHAMDKCYGRDKDLHEKK